MSGPRRLWVRFRSVDPERRFAYREAVIAAGVTAVEGGAHFWAFEVDGGEDTFIEFLEGPGDPVLTSLCESTDELLRTAGGESDSPDPRVGSNLRGTEFA